MRFCDSCNFFWLTFLGIVNIFLTFLCELVQLLILVLHVKEMKQACMVLILLGCLFVNNIRLYSTGYHWLVTGGLHLKCRFSRQKAAITMSMWSLSGLSWVTGLLHWRDVGVRVKRLEWLKTKHFFQGKKGKETEKKNENENEKKIKIGIRAWKYANNCIACGSMSLYVEILLNGWTSY